MDLEEGSDELEWFEGEEDVEDSKDDSAEWDWYGDKQDYEDDSMEEEVIKSTSSPPPGKK